MTSTRTSADVLRSELGLPEMGRVVEAMAEGGWWHACTGCHETFEGHETGDYPYSPVFQCHVGAGCSECGGIGVVWFRFTDEDAAALEAEMTSDPVLAERESGR